MLRTYTEAKSPVFIVGARPTIPFYLLRRTCSNGGAIQNNWWPLSQHVQVHAFRDLLDDGGVVDDPERIATYTTDQR
jgi:hypothetical protein